jgi:hypothetical protein
MKQFLLYITVYTIVAATLSGVLDAPVDLTCSRAAPRGSVNCAKQTRLLWAISLPQQRIDDVRGARVSISSDDEGVGYRVELLAAHGTVPLTFVYSSGRSTKDKVADEINAFVRRTAPGTLTVTEPGLLSVENVVWMLIWLPFAALGHFVWQGIKSRFGGARPAWPQ